MLSQLSDALQNRVDKIITDAESQNFRIECTIKHTDNPDISIELPFISNLEIDQGFSVIYTDNITLDTQLSIKDFMTLINNHQNLIAILKFIYVDIETTEDILERLPETYIFRCIIKNTTDLTKEYSLGEIQQPTEYDSDKDYDSIMYDVFFQLIDDTSYNIRHKEVNFILHDSTVKQCIRYIASVLGIPNVYIEEPDNQRVLPHIIITPPKSIMDIFDYIQYTYGVYNTGIEYYFRNNTLYVYKAYDTDPESKTIKHIYNVQEGSYPGQSGYHYVDEDGTHILSNTKVKTKNLIELGVENTGNSVSFIRADTMIDKQVSITNDKGVTIDDDNVVTCELATTKGAASDVHVNKHSSSTNNIFVISSELAKNLATIVSLGWVHAVPFSFLPGQKIAYHFDDEDRVYVYKTGRCEYITYSIKPVAQKETWIFACTARLALRVDMT